MRRWLEVASIQFFLQPHFVEMRKNDAEAEKKNKTHTFCNTLLDIIFRITVLTTTTYASVVELEEELVNLYLTTKNHSLIHTVKEGKVYLLLSDFP